VRVILSHSGGLDGHIANLVFANAVHAGDAEEFVGAVVFKVISFTVDEGFLEITIFSVSVSPATLSKMPIVLSTDTIFEKRI
jgi:hypothetical protein